MDADILSILGQPPLDLPGGRRRVLVGDPDPFAKPVPEIGRVLAAKPAQRRRLVGRDDDDRVGAAAGART